MKKGVNGELGMVVLWNKKRRRRKKKRKRKERKKFFCMTAWIFIVCNKRASCTTYLFTIYLLVITDLPNFCMIV